MWIHRPSAVFRDEGDGSDGGDSGEIIPRVLHYCKLLNAGPLVDNVGGFVNLVPLGRVVDSLSSEISASVPRAPQPQLRFLHEMGHVDIPLAGLGLKSYIDAEAGKSPKAGAAQLSPDEFASKAAAAGMDELLVALVQSLPSMQPVTWPRLVRK